MQTPGDQLQTPEESLAHARGITCRRQGNHVQMRPESLADAVGDALVLLGAVLLCLWFAHVLVVVWSLRMINSCDSGDLACLLELEMH